MGNLQALVLIVIFAFISGCNSDSSSDTATEKKTLSEAVFSEGNITLGPVKDSIVKIHPFQSDYESYTLFETKSDINGKISINISEINKNIEKYGLSPQYLLIVANGGVDTDPNDDGISLDSEFKTVAGSIFGLVNAENPTHSTKFNVNLISSTIVEYFLGQDKIEKEDIEMFLIDLGFTDQDGNGIIDLDDVINYDMIKDHSVVEDTLRTLYLDYVHSGDKVMRELVLSNLTERKNIYRIRISYKNSFKVDMEIYPNNTKGVIDYYHANNSDLIIENNQSGFASVSLNAGEGIYFRECLEKDCSNYELIYFDGNNIKKGNIPLNSLTGIYKDEDSMNRVRASFVSMVDNYINYDNFKLGWISDLNKLKQELTENSNQIKSLESEMAVTGVGYD